MAPRNELSITSPSDLELSVEAVELIDPNGQTAAYHFFETVGGAYAVSRALDGKQRNPNEDDFKLLIRGEHAEVIRQTVTEGLTFLADVSSPEKSLAARALLASLED